MAEEFLVVIPSDPSAVVPGTANALRDALAGMAGTDEASVKDYDKLQFIDAGEHATSIRCPSCGQDLAPEAWQRWMSADWHGADGFHLHRHTMPCCGHETTLNGLIYDAPQGFARWFASARNPGRGALTETEMRELERIAGMKLKTIRQRY
jgi:hypothetical protein